jgi:hypothetical protein
MDGQDTSVTFRIIVNCSKNANKEQPQVGNHNHIAEGKNNASTGIVLT